MGLKIKCNLRNNIILDQESVSLEGVIGIKKNHAKTFTVDPVDEAVKAV